MLNLSKIANAAAVAQAAAKAKAAAEANAAAIAKTATVAKASTIPMPTKSISQAQTIASTISGQGQNIASVFVDSTTVTTDALAVMQYVQGSAKYTNASFTWSNTSEDPATFRVVSANKDYSNQVVRSEEIVVAAAKPGVAVCTGLNVNSKYYFFLQRLEGEVWEKQASGGGGTDTAKTYVLVTTYPPPTVNTSTTSTDAMLEWQAYHYPATYTVEIYKSAALRATADDPFETIDANRIALVDNKKTWRCSASGLSHGTRYFGVVSTVEAVGTTNDIIDLAEFEFEASERADMKVNAIGASFVDLSWDTTDVGADEKDGEAEFNLTYEEAVTTAQGVKWIERGVLMESKPDTTRTFTAHGLKPDTLYNFLLNRLDFSGSFVFQANKTVTTETSSLTLSGSTSTFFTADWTRVYNNATYKVEFSNGGQTISSPETNSLTREMGGLLSGSGYEVSLFIKENNAFILLDTESIVTDRKAQIRVLQPKNTAIDLIVASPESAVSGASYYVSDGSGSVKTPNFEVNETSSDRKEGSWFVRGVELVGSQNDKTYDLTLYRLEYGTWVRQGSVTISTVSPTVATSVSTEAALIKWDNQYAGAEYQVRIFKPGSAFSQTISVSEADGDDLSAISTGLDKNTNYHGELLAEEQGEFKVVKSFTFQTSIGATFLVNKIFASYAEVAWDDKGAGSDEEDSEAEFMVKVMNSKTNTWVFDSGWIPDSISNIQTTGLTPGVQHNFHLYRRGVDGEAVRQAGMDLDAKTTNLIVSELSSSRMVVSWASIYPGARYKLTHKADDEDAITFGGQTMVETTALLTNLDASTKYEIELWVEEIGKSVPISTAALGSALIVSTTVDYKFMAAVVAAVALLVALVLMKIRK